MALTINPAVSGSHRSWLARMGSFYVGAFIGALISLALAATLLSVVRLFLPGVWILFSGLILIMWGILHDVGVPLPLPYRPQQVPEGFRELLPPTAVAAVFGLQLGFGLLTLFTYSTHLAMIVGLPFLTSFGKMLYVLALFAMGKTIVIAGAAGASSLDEITTRFRWSRQRLRLLRVVTASASFGVALSVLSRL